MGHQVRSVVRPRPPPSMSEREYAPIALTRSVRRGGFASARSALSQPVARDARGATTFLSLGLGR